jgi:hypothetical protein
VHGNRENWPAVPSSEWAHRLGQQRLARDESVARITKSEEEDAAQAAAASVERWPAIVDAIRRLADAYNAGVGRTVLTVVETAGPPGVTVAAEGGGTPSLSATLDDSVVSIHARDARGVTHAADVRLRADRDDRTTAAYFLQDWMQHL